MNKIELVYYFGVIILTSGVILIMIQKFRYYDSIDIKNHIIMITIYIILLVFAIILWRLFYDLLFGITDILNIDNSIYKRVING